MKNYVLRCLIIIHFENMVEFELFNPIFNFQHTQILKFFTINVDLGSSFSMKRMILFCITYSLCFYLLEIEENHEEQQ